ncbi:MAG: hypothetical protein Q7U37_04575 [Gallionella sp.]|nr:hypothetical protein [Gallionella sp.]MDP1941021.1 hypothetical protein [Gallionella sp.]
MDMVYGVPLVQVALTVLVASTLVGLLFWYAANPRPPATVKALQLADTVELTPIAPTATIVAACALPNPKASATAATIFNVLTFFMIISFKKNQLTEKTSEVRNKFAANTLNQSSCH